MLADLGMASAGVLAVTFAWAGAAKLSRPADTRAGFTELGLRWPTQLAGAVPVAEFALAVALLAIPVAGGGAAALLLSLFCVVLIRALRTGVAVRCACFGQVQGPPLSWVEVVRNGFLIGLALLALAAGTEPRVPGLAAIGVVALATGIGAGLVARWRRQQV